MKLQRTLVARAVSICVACAFSAGPATVMGATSYILPSQTPVVAGERLSNWILRSAGPHVDTTALHWTVAAERLGQMKLQQAVVHGLRAAPMPSLTVSERSALVDWLQSMPVTGRVNLPVTDARWLQGNPDQDPILQEGHGVALYPRSNTVTVLTGTGSGPCTVPHVPGALAQDYLHACRGADAENVSDWAWVVQSDGTTKQFGIAPWNLQPQDEPGEGAVLWVPPRSLGIPLSVSDNLARFLATQAPPIASSSVIVSPVTPIDISSSIWQTRPAATRLTASDWGEIGLLQTPTARMAPAGDARLQLSRVTPYTRGSILLQPLDWLEAGFRYTDISNRAYGPVFGKDQTYKDKSIDIKVRLREENHLLPQIAFGLRDLGGTGLFSSEYVVASKRWGNWDASLGIGWGYLGARGNLKNPLSLVASEFAARPVVVNGVTGTPSTQIWFHGPSALFGGVQWQSPESPWTLKFELEGNDYQHEPIDNAQVTRSPFNFGAVYSYSPNIDLSVAYERGNQLMLGMTFHGGLNRLYSPKLLDPVLPKPQTFLRNQAPPGGHGNTAANIQMYTGWTVRAISHVGNTTVLEAEVDTAVHLQDRVDRATTVLHRDTPAGTGKFVIKLSERGLPMSDITVNRAEWLSRFQAPESSAMLLPAQQLAPGTPATRGVGSAISQPGFNLDVGPSYGQILGGPDGFLLYQVGAQAKLDHRFSDSTWLTGALDLRLLDNYGKFKYDAPSDLPRVRTFAREYVTASRITLPLFQVTHVQQLARNQYISAYGGMLESMYGGIGAEWLHRPWQGNLAIGVDANYVRQRAFRQDFSFRDYGVGTGHAALYWDTGWNDVQVKLSAGRYLAGDIGATLDVKRVFQNGVTIGAWGTKTNVSAEQFGEGSFDKVIYVTLPFDVMLPKSSPGTASIVWNPLTRDGGARLNRRFNLIDLTRQRDWRALHWRPSHPETDRSARDTSYILSEPTPNIFQTIGSSGSTLVGQVAGIPASNWLWAGGAVLAASMFDKPLDNWTTNHQTPGWNRVGSIGNNLPIVMGLGAALLYAGMAGPEAASTAETSLKAGAYAMGASFMTRFAVGRARPYQELGNANFDGFNTGAFQSGFTSNHVSLAFALATPFAQKHDMPWLYGMAGLTALGRIQSRDHWVSDTVASAFMGYGIGTLVGLQSKSTDRTRIEVTPQSIKATWAY